MASQNRNNLRSSRASSLRRSIRLSLIMMSGTNTFHTALARVESPGLRILGQDGSSSSSSYHFEDEAAARLLFWSNYGLSIDAAEQHLGPLDSILRGGEQQHEDDIDAEEEKDVQHTEEALLRPNSSWSDATTTATSTINNTQVRLSRTRFPAVLSSRGGSQKPKQLEYSLFQQGDGSETDPDGIPTRFLAMHNQNRKMAEQSLKSTMKWRNEHNIDQILNHGHTKFNVAKSVFPHYFLGRNPDNKVVFVQHPARLDLDKARVNNLIDEELLMHYVYVNEYLWQVIEREDALATMVSVIDLQGMNLGLVRRGDILSFIKKFVSTMDSFYPQRAHKTLLLNVPKWFNIIYKLVSPLMRETTKSKIEIHSRSKAQDEAIRQFLGDEAAKLLPDFFWSSWKPPKRSRKRKRGKNAEEDSEETPSEEFVPPPESSMERDLRDFVVARTEAEGRTMQVVV